MAQKTTRNAQDDLRRSIAAGLDVRAPSFQAAVRRAGRLLPARARDAAADLAALDARMAHPKLAARTDPAVIRQAENRFRRSLPAHPPGLRAARQRALLGAEIAFRLAVVIGLVLAFVYWAPMG